MVVVARIKVQLGKEAVAETAFRKQLEFVSREEPATLQCVLHRSRKDPTVFLSFERYADGAAFDRHGKSAGMRELFAVLQPILDGAPSIELLDEIGRAKEQVP